MTFLEFLAEPAWDSPFFKRLARNDTGEASGHQGGMVLPKELRKFLPNLDEGTTNAAVPTTDRHLSVEMYLGVSKIAEGIVRYQLQTWGGTRSAESRITGGFGPLRSEAAAGDMLIFQRHLESLARFRLILVKISTREFSEIESVVGDRKCGPLNLAVPPVAQLEINVARAEIDALTGHPFELLRPVIPRVESSQRRIARSIVFRERVRMEYQNKCAVSGIVIASPRPSYEVEAAHVVPLSAGGSDDARNGVALMQSLHWAFDRGLFGVKPDRTIYLPRKVRAMPDNGFLLGLAGRHITEARTDSLRTHPAAFEWHIRNRVSIWE